MELVKCSIKNIRGVGLYKKSDNLMYDYNGWNILEEFVESGLECAEVKNFTQKNAEICASSLANSIKHYGFSGIAAISRKNHVYLIRDDILTKNVDNIQMAYNILVSVMNDPTSTFHEFATATEEAIEYLGSELSD